MAKETATTSAWDRDKLYGMRMDQAFAEREPFALIGKRIEDGDTIPTDIGDAQVVHLLVCKLGDSGEPIGNPFEVNTIARAILDKMNDVQEGDLPAKVVWFKTYSKKYKTDCTVLQYVSESSPDELAQSYGVDVQDALDAFRPVGQRMPI